jgi:CMP/dCMP kinase
MSKAFQIAIDGPVAAGKSSVAKRLSEKLNFTYIDTGAMYRCVALAAQRAGVDWHDGPAVEQVAKSITIDLLPPSSEEKNNRKVTVLLDGEDVSHRIREIEYGEGASIVGTHAAVRKVMVAKQRELGGSKEVVMEGRDIGTTVLPKADLKIYLSAELDERVRRRTHQLERLGEEVTKGIVEHDVIDRDERELHRKVEPLHPADDAWMLDTTDLSIDQVVEVIIERVTLLRDTNL